ncbi:MAG: hypothetical protein RMK80_05875, partial [Pseudobdellovibrionaceae bacterium]|nr:hypothetical protein [Pseudobdellovibrionaceae bacterium]
ITPNRFTELRDCINSSTITEACRHPFSLPLQADTASPPFVGSRSNPVRYGFRGQMCDPSNSDEACPIHFFNECVVRCPEKEPNDLSGVCPQVKRVICNHYLAIVRFFFLMSPEALNSGFREHRFTLRLNNSLDRWLYLPE